MTVINAINNRRSHRLLSNQQVVSDEILIASVSNTLKHTPSSFNAQSQTLMLLLNESHQMLWNIVLNALRKIVPSSQFAKTESKINTFIQAYGTILYFDNTRISNQLAQDYPLYKHNVETWAKEQNGMLQSNIWLVLTELGYGASLQHYTELIEDEVKTVFNVPSEWKLVAQMPFGKPVERPNEKKFIPIEERIIIKF